jgi:hypothetical protein
VSESKIHRPDVRLGRLCPIVGTAPAPDTQGADALTCVFSFSADGIVVPAVLRSLEQLPVESAERVPQVVVQRELCGCDDRLRGTDGQVPQGRPVRMQHLLRATSQPQSMPTPDHLHERYALLGGQGPRRFHVQGRGQCDPGGAQQPAQSC